MAVTRASQMARQSIELTAPKPLTDGALLGVASKKLGWKLRRRLIQHLIHVRLEYQGFSVWALRSLKSGKLIATLTALTRGRN